MAVRALASVSLTPLFLAGCSSTEPSKASTESVPAINKPAVVNSLHLPIEKFLFSNDEISAIQRSRQLLIERCLARFSVSYRFGDPGPLTGPLYLTERRYGLNDRDMARAYGYHLGDRDPRSHKFTPPPVPEPKILPFLNGPQESRETSSSSGNAEIPKGGCVGEADAKLSASNKIGASDVAQYINRESFARSKSIPPVRAAFKKWSSCMTGKGFSYSDPFAAMADPRFQANVASGDEVRVAVADVDCKMDANLVKIWFQEESEIQRSMLAEKRFQSPLRAAADDKIRQLRVASSTRNG